MYENVQGQVKHKTALEGKESFSHVLRYVCLCECVCFTSVRRYNSDEKSDFILILLLKGTLLDLATVRNSCLNCSNVSFKYLKLIF